MKKIKLLLILATILISSLNVFAKSKENKIEPFQKTSNIFCQEFDETAKRNDLLFKDIQVEKIISKYSPFFSNKPDTFYYPTEDDNEIVMDYTIDFIKDSIRETSHHVEWVDDFKDDFKEDFKDFSNSNSLFSFFNEVYSYFGYGFSIKGEEADGETYSPTLNEERRLDSLERKERKEIEFVVPELGKRYRFDLDFRYRPKKIVKKEIFGSLELKASLTDFQIFKHKFNKAELRFRSDQETKFSVTKLLGNRWYSGFSAEFNSFPNDLDNLGISFIKETSNNNSRSLLNLGVFYYKEMESYVPSAKLIYRFR